MSDSLETARRGRGGFWRWTIWRAMAWSLTVAIAITALAVAQVKLSNAVHEDGLVEIIHTGIWYFAGAYALAGALWVSPRDRGILLLLASLGVAAAARESDLHTMLNPETLGYWGVRYRTRWWISGSSPVGARLLWGGIIAVGIAYGVHLVRRVLPAMGKNHAWLGPVFLGILGMFFVSFACDDLLRFRVPLAAAQTAEETVETAAAMLFALAVGRLRGQMGAGEIENRK